VVDYFNANTCVVWEGNVTTRKEISAEKHLLPVDIRDIREGMTLRRVILWRLGYKLVIVYIYSTLDCPIGVGEKLMWK
jgi:hypothetical protein